jgi:chitodextrinase
MSELSTNISTKQRFLQLLPVLFLALLIPISMIAFNVIRNIFTQASPEKQPKEVHITDVTDSSFVVSWITDTSTKGEILYSTDKNLSNPLTAKDSRDETSVTPRDTHYVRLVNLNPNTTYYFQIISDSEKYGDDDNVFEMKTAETPESPSVPSPIKGIVSNGS